MSSYLLDVFDGFASSEYADRFRDVKVKSLEVNKRINDLTAVLESTQLISYAALTGFSGYLSEIFPDYSIHVTDMFDPDTLIPSDITTLIRLYCINEVSVPLEFFDPRTSAVDGNSITVSVIRGMSFLESVGFADSFREFVGRLTGRRFTVTLDPDDSSEKGPEEFKLPDPVKKVEVKHRDFEVPGHEVTDGSVKTFLGKYFVPKNPVSIREAPDKNGKITVIGRVFAVTVRGNFRKVYNYSIHDGTGSINVKILLSPNETDLDRYDDIKPGVWFAVNGECSMDKYERDWVINPYRIVMFDVPEKRDEAAEKRVELHLHTKLSALDAVIGPDEAVRRAHRMGHRAVAITDHGVVQAFPQAMLEAEAIQKNDPDFKVIYGCEGYMVDNIITAVTDGARGTLRDTEFVVFDIETTGLNPNTEALTEIGDRKSVV